jgi:hypothetical protein
MLDKTLWDALERCGVTARHMRALLAFLHCQWSGVFGWHGRLGHLDHCELRLSFRSNLDVRSPRMLDGTLWAELERCGVTEGHMLALLAFLHCQRHGVFEWHGRLGRLDHCELNFSFRSKPHDLGQVQAMLEGMREESFTR